MFVRGYLDEPYGKAILTNAALFAVEAAFPELPDTHPYKQIANAAVVTAYQEAIQSFNIQDTVKQLFSGEKMKGVLDKFATAEGKEQ